MKTGAILVNVGTPLAPEPAPVRAYLREFLMDRWVIDLPWPLRWLLVNGVILRDRPRTSAESYRRIWSASRGSPLLYHLEDLVAGVSARLGSDWVVKPAMRYGQPSIEKTFEELKRAEVNEAVVLPLYPQYSLAATLSAVEKCEKEAGKLGIRVRFVPPFYAGEGFISAFEQVGRNALAEFKPDFVLFSYHGLPERHLRKLSRSAMKHCLRSRSCCDTIAEANRDCYRAQCFATTKLLAARLGLKAEEFAISFQSRLGRTPWIEPHTDKLLPELAAGGKRKIAVFCPSFVADCLETVEEIGIREKERFLSSGGEELHLVPSLNAEPVWAEAVAGMIRATPQ